MADAEGAKAYAHAAQLAGYQIGVTLKESIQFIKSSIASQIENFEEERALHLMYYSYASAERLPGYATLNHRHIQETEDVVRKAWEYLVDPSLVRPLNFLLLASPGSGKSQLIKSFTKRLDPEESVFEYVPFNMATMESKEDLIHVLDHARNAAINHKLPLVFLDEFDSDESHYSLLLPLLWDGALNIGDRNLLLGRSIFFLAGSRRALPLKLAKARAGPSPHGADVAGEPDDGKLVDLFSRINGTVIQLPSLGGRSQENAADKIIVAMHLLRQRFKRCQTVPWRLLWFIAKSDFRYEARSIATLINLIPTPANQRADDVSELTHDDLDLLELTTAEDVKASPLAYHLNHDYGEMGLAQLWGDARAIKGNQPLRHASALRPAVFPVWLREMGTKYAGQGPSGSA